MKRSVVRARGVPLEAPNAVGGAIWRSRKQSTDFTDFTECSEKSKAASSRRTPAGPMAAHLEGTPSWSRVVVGGQSPPWTARAGGGPVFLPEIIYVRFSKRTHMTAPGKTGKLRFSEGIRVFRCPGTRESNSFFTKRSQMKGDSRLEPGLRKPSPLPVPPVVFGIPASAGLRSSCQFSQTPVQVSQSQSKPVKVKPTHKEFQLDPARSDPIRPDPTRFAKSDQIRVNLTI